MPQSSQNPLSAFGPRAHPSPLARIVLVEPLIPENTGNISRTCVATGSELHLVEPMAFEITEARVRRAGLDYWPDLAWLRHSSFSAWADSVRGLSPDSVRGLSADGLKKRIFFIETSGLKSIYDVTFQRGDHLVFGKETYGLTLEQIDFLQNDAGFHVEVLSIPMPGTTRSLNLSNAVAVVAFELLRQVRRDGMLGE
jgi:tRNA (cytidine/uridine-2'-O-)-methyltransferase